MRFGILGIDRGNLTTTEGKRDREHGRKSREQLGNVALVVLNRFMCVFGDYVGSVRR